MTQQEIINLAVSITEKAAFASSLHTGKNDQKKADQAAVTAMRKAFLKAPIDGLVVIGEGERDEAPMLFIGEKAGLGPGHPPFDIAVDPLEGTGLCARGEKGALSVLALAEKNSLLHAPDVYMDKLACGKKAKNKLHIQNTPQENIKILSEILNKPPDKLKIAVLDRPRHQTLIQNLREAGAPPLLFGDGDVSMALLAAMENHKDSIDLLLGSGGAPEGVLSALALKSLGGDFQGRLLWKNQEQKQRALSMGLQNPDQVFQIEDLAKGDGVFCASGVTESPLVQGLQQKEDQVFIETFVLHTQNPEYKIIKNTHSLKDLQKEII